MFQTNSISNNLFWKWLFLVWNVCVVMVGLSVSVSSHLKWHSSVTGWLKSRGYCNRLYESGCVWCVCLWECTYTWHIICIHTKGTYLFWKHGSVHHSSVFPFLYFCFPHCIHLAHNQSHILSFVGILTQNHISGQSVLCDHVGSAAKSGCTPQRDPPATSVPLWRLQSFPGLSLIPSRVLAVLLCFTALTESPVPNFNRQQRRLKHFDQFAFYFVLYIFCWI